MTIKQYAVYSKSTGQFLRGGLCSENAIMNQAGEGEVVVEADGSAENFILIDGVLKPAPPNAQLMQKMLVDRVVEHVSDRRIGQITLMGSRFDANDKSMSRIAGMIARLQRGDGLPQGWIGWRDAQNQMHWSQDDAATVLTNLTALSRAIEDREQALLVASWTHKENITKLQTIEEILQYDVTQNWPT